ncbi:MAG: DEAD/DEAH box helicase family protein [Clostridiales bacterium]|nr:DEAD/DEAH box helicase family protein [Clostridiales bacterium]
MTKGDKNIWVKDLIGDDYKEWSKENVILDCGTGSGKSYFCIHILGQYAKENGKKLLYLCNSRKLYRQKIDEVKGLKLIDTIWVTTYQTLQQKLKEGKWIRKQYDYIIVDECHYFFSDALFNDCTDVAYKYITREKESVIIWVSATAKAFINWLQENEEVKEERIYTIPKDYSYVKQLYIYQREDLVPLLTDILAEDTESKIVVFCNSAKRILELSDHFGKSANYFCSNSCNNRKVKNLCGYNYVSYKEYNKETDSLEEKRYRTIKDCIANVDNKITFEKRILFTTSVLDNGIDLKDENIKHVFSELSDIDLMLQSFGRKRPINENDTCTFYLREYKANEVQGFININKKQLEPIDMYLDDYDKFCKKYGRDRNALSKMSTFYLRFKENGDNEIGLNTCRYLKYKIDSANFKKMAKVGHLSVALEALGEDLTNMRKRVIVNKKEIDLFMDYLKSLEGKMVYTQDKEELEKKFELTGKTLRNVGINTVNGALRDTYINDSSYVSIPQFINKDEKGKLLKDNYRKLPDGTSNPNKNKRYWILTWIPKQNT